MTKKCRTLVNLGFFVFLFMTVRFSVSSKPSNLNVMKMEQPELQRGSLLQLEPSDDTLSKLFSEQLQAWLKEMENPNVSNYISHLLRGIHADMYNSKNRHKRSIFSGKVNLRKEIREPPYDDNWGRYVRNVRRLKHNYDVSNIMSTFDVIANLHAPEHVIRAAHDGPGFFAWHRVFLRVMEQALGCPLPYWDTRPDEAMDDPSLSVVWSDKYFGDGYGLVTNGIMKDLPSPLPIYRNINDSADGYGWLISYKDVRDALRKSTMMEFTSEYNCHLPNRSSGGWECIHSGLHYWIGGTFNPSKTSSFEPIFYPIHAFIDKIFERFRQKLVSNGVDPEATYPDHKIHRHGPEHKTIWIPIYPGIESLTNRQCYGAKLASLTQYSKGPKCPDCYDSDDLYCDHGRDICVAVPYHSDSVSYHSDSVPYHSDTEVSHTIDKVDGSHADVYDDDDYDYDIGGYDKDIW